MTGCFSSEEEPVTPTPGDISPTATTPPIDASAPARTETATFALGCFWGPDAQFGIIPGVVRTRVGYAGGIKENPTYHNLGDHTETVQIDYDPEQISYRELLDIFWNSHYPASPSPSTQYMSIIFYHDEKQQKLAMETRASVEASIGRQVYTEIVPFSKFYLAETYHQKFRLQQKTELMKDFNAMYPNIEDFINSTAAARVNGYVNGLGTLEGLKKDLNSFGLSPQANKALLSIVAGFSD